MTERPMPKTERNYTRKVKIFFGNLRYLKTKEMTAMKKTEVINFHDFMNGENGIGRVDYKKCINKKTVLTINPFIISTTSILNPPPMIVTGYLIVLGVGGLLVLAAFLENHFNRCGDGDLADIVGTLLNVGLPIGAIVALIIFVLKNPLL